MTENNPFASPAAQVISADGVNNPENYQYLGFWKRVVASIVDNVIVCILSIPLAYISVSVIKNATAVYIVNNSLGSILALVVILVLWHLYASTPGKMIFNAKILDEKTLKKPTFGKFVIRYIGYIVSTLGLFIGFIWIAFDSKKRGWHDLMAGTVVVSPRTVSARNKNPITPLKA